MKLCVFPNDPIIAYFKKGEIKDRYYNPCNLFEELHIISFTEKDIEPEKVQKIAGNAKIVIHSVGKINLINKNSKRKKVLKIIQEVKPDVIRAYNALLEGWVGAFCSKELKIPFFVSLHVQYDTKRNFEKSKNYKKYLALKYYRRSIEPYTLNATDKITIVYKNIRPYVESISKKNPEILYNRVDLKKFRDAKKNQSFEKPLIITVGRLTSRKNHDCLIKAIKNLDVSLQIIGDGEEYENLVNLVNKMKLTKKVSFIKSVPNEKIQEYYKSANLFVSMYNPEIEGLPIPVLEAMAAGLPVIISKPVEGLSDGLEGTVLFSDIEPNSVEIKIRKILEDHSFAEDLARKALEKSNDFDGEKTEKKEAEIYQELINRK